MKLNFTSAILLACMAFGAVTAAQYDVKKYCMYMDLNTVQPIADNYVGALESRLKPLSLSM